MTEQREQTPQRQPRRPGSRVVRALWLVFGAIMVVAALAWGSYNVVTVLAHEERTEMATYPAGTVTSLDVDNSAGSVSIIGTDASEISVITEMSDGLRKTGSSQQVVGSVLQLRGSCPNFGSDWCRVDFEIEVPRDMAVVVASDDGSIDIVGVTGSVDVNGSNGSIEVADLTGPLVIDNDNGRITGSDLRSASVEARSDNGRVTLEFAAAPTTVVAASDNGRVEVVVPATGETYRVEMSTDNGSETNDVPTDPASTRSLTITSDNGSVTARTAG